MVTVGLVQVIHVNLVEFGELSFLSNMSPESVQNDMSNCIWICWAFLQTCLSSE